MDNSASVFMMKGQLATNGIHAPSVVEALLHVDRSLFLPESLRGVACVDGDLPLTKGRYLLEPLTFARMLEYAGITTDHNVLDVGAGYGYSSAVLSRLSNNVVAIEESPELVASARTLFASLNIRTIDIITATLTTGCNTHQPYDRILIQGALPAIPTLLEEQLAEGGVLVGLRFISSVFATQKGLADIVVGVKQGDVMRYVEKERIHAYALTCYALSDAFHFAF
jgi:protein-L-isoaspartate(D-aspartate) O-methyltransferase